MPYSTRCAGKTADNAIAEAHSAHNVQCHHIGSARAHARARTCLCWSRPTRKTPIHKFAKLVEVGCHVQPKTCAKRVSLSNTAHMRYYMGFWAEKKTDGWEVRGCGTNGVGFRRSEPTLDNTTKHCMEIKPLRPPSTPQTASTTNTIHIHSPQV